MSVGLILVDVVSVKRQAAKARLAALRGEMMELAGCRKADCVVTFGTMNLNLGIISHCIYSYGFL